MAIRDYITINNYSGRGRIGISRDAIAAIASYSIREVPGAVPFVPRPHRTSKRAKAKASKVLSAPEGVSVIFAKDGCAHIKLEVSLRRGVSVPEAAGRIQEAVGESLRLMCDTIPFDIQVKVMRIE